MPPACQPPPGLGLSRVRALLARGERRDDGGRGGLAHARNGRDLLDRGCTQALERAEVLEQGRLAHRAEPGHVVEGRGRHRPRATPAVRLDREAVRLVADALHEVQTLRGTREDHGELLPREPHLLEPLREPAQRDVVDPEIGERARRRGDLGRAAVDDDEVRRVREPLGTPLLVDGTRGRFGVVELDVRGGVPLLEVPAEPPGQDLVDRCGVVACALPVRPAYREGAVLGLARETVLEHDHRGHLVRAHRGRHVVALDAQRRARQLEGLLDLLERLAARREVARASRAVQRERLLGVLAHRLGELALVPALGHADAHARATQPREPRRDLVRLGRQDRHEDLARDRARGVGVLRRRTVDLLQEVLDELGVARVLDLLDDPAPLTTDAPTAHVEHLDGRLELVTHETEDVGVRPVPEHDGVLLGRTLESRDVVAQARRGLEVELLGRGLHPRGEVAHEARGVPGHEVAEVLGERAVVLDRDAPDARRRALVDVAEQARAPLLLGAAVHARRAGAHGEDPQQQVDRLADRPRVRVGPEVARALALGAPHDLDPRDLLAERDREEGVGLVVAVLDVEPRVELLDPRVLERKRLDLGAHDGPLDRGRRREHRLGALVQVRDVLEVARQARSQILGLADVDDPPLGVEEAVHAGRRRDVARPRAVRRGVSHASSLMKAHDGEPSG
jgi:hypothetical protein